MPKTEDWQPSTNVEDKQGQDTSLQDTLLMMLLRKNTEQLGTDLHRRLGMILSGGLQPPESVPPIDPQNPGRLPIAAGYYDLTGWPGGFPSGASSPAGGMKR